MSDNAALVVASISDEMPMKVLVNSCADSDVVLDWPGSSGGGVEAGPVELAAAGEPRSVITFDSEEVEDGGSGAADVDGLPIVPDPTSTGLAGEGVLLSGGAADSTGKSGGDGVGVMLNDCVVEVALSREVGLSKLPESAP